MNRSIFLIFIFCSIMHETGAQMLVGTVKDQDSGAAIEHATVYFSGTSNGVFTDQYGRFTINISNYNGMPLAISALGYYSNEIQEPDPEKKYSVLLTPKTYELNEVIVEAKGRSYRAKYRRSMNEFRKQFLGITLNAQKCQILNESDLYFSSHDGVLLAYAYKPLEIENPGLGYMITYYLEKFEYHYSTNSVWIKGNMIFEDRISSYDKISADRIEKKRKTAYLGSRMHFFRSLWQNNLDSAGFEIKNDHNEKISTSDIIVEEEDNKPDIAGKYLDYDGLIRISYFTKIPTSSMKCNTQKVYFEKSGHFEPLDVTWRGELSVQRIADLLPLEYVTKEKRK